MSSKQLLLPMPTLQVREGGEGRVREGINCLSAEFSDRMSHHVQREEKNILVSKHKEGIICMLVAFAYGLP